MRKSCLNLLIARCENEALNLFLLLLLRAECPIEIVKQNWDDFFSKFDDLNNYFTKVNNVKNDANFTKPLPSTYYIRQIINQFLA